MNKDNWRYENHMTMNEYQDRANATSGAYGVGVDEVRLLAALVGLGGEVGEVLNLIKKRIWHKHDIQDAQIAEELGDALWYIAEACAALGVDLEVVAGGNLQKLEKRYGGAFSVEKSRERVL